MRRIAVIYLGRNGGGPVYAYEMTRGLIENEYNVTAFISARVENINSWKAIPGLNLEIIDTFSSGLEYVCKTINFRFMLYKSLAKKYNDERFDACYIPMGNFWDPFFVKICKYPQLICTVHDPIWHSSDDNLLEKIKMRLPGLLLLGVKKKKPDDIVVLSKVFLSTAMEKYHLERNHVHVVPHGIFDFYKNVDAGNVFEYEENKTNFLFFGRICGYKGIDTLAEAYRLLTQKNKDVTLTIVGSGDFYEYESLYNGLENVRVINKWIPDEEVASFFKTDRKLILVLPYKDGTQSGVIPIAMSFGVPVIVSNTGGLVEQVEDNVTGFLCEAKEPQSLFECMEKVIEVDTSNITTNAQNYIKTLDWISLSKKVGEIIKL